MVMLDIWPFWITWKYWPFSGRCWCLCASACSYIVWEWLDTVTKLYSCRKDEMLIELNAIVERQCCIFMMLSTGERRFHVSLWNIKFYGVWWKLLNSHNTVHIEGLLYVMIEWGGHELFRFCFSVFSTRRMESESQEGKFKAIQDLQTIKVYQGEMHFIMYIKRHHHVILHWSVSQHSLELDTLLFFAAINVIMNWKEKHYLYSLKLQQNGEDCRDLMVACQYIQSLKFLFRRNVAKKISRLHEIFRISRFFIFYHTLTRAMNRLFYLRYGWMSDMYVMT